MVSHTEFHRNNWNGPIMLSSIIPNGGLRPSLKLNRYNSARLSTRDKSPPHNSPTRKRPHHSAYRHIYMLPSRHTLLNPLAGRSLASHGLMWQSRFNCHSSSIYLFIAENCRNVRGRVLLNILIHPHTEQRSIQVFLCRF